MVEQTFLLKKDIFERRKLTTLQHKLRVVLKCYTIRNFILNDNNTFVFNISHRINGRKFDVQKEYFGSFTVEDINDKEIDLKISI